MMVDLNKLSAFSVSDKKEIRFNINDNLGNEKLVIYEIPFCLSVNKKEKRLYVGTNCAFIDNEDGMIDLTDKDIETILSGDDSAIVSACTDFAWSLILKNKYCKE